FERYPSETHSCDDSRATHESALEAARRPACRMSMCRGSRRGSLLAAWRQRATALCKDSSGPGTAVGEQLRVSKKKDVRKAPPNPSLPSGSSRPGVEAWREDFAKAQEF